MKKSMGLTRRLFLRNTSALAAATAFSSALFPAAYRSPAAAEEKPIVIGHQSDLTGPLGHSAYWTSKAVDGAVKYLNANGGVGGRPVKVIRVDTQMQVDVGVRRLHRLIQEANVDFVIGAEHGGIVSASIPTVKDFKVPYFPVSRTDKITTELANKYTFRLTSTPRSAARATAGWAVKELGKRWSVVVADYAWGHAQRDSWTEEVSRAGGAVIQAIELPINTADPLPYLIKIDRTADAIFLALLGPDATRVFPALRNLGLNTKPALAGATTLALFDSQSLGQNIEGVWAVDEIPWELSGSDIQIPNLEARRHMRSELSVDKNVREVGTGNFVVTDDMWPGWEVVGFLKRLIEGSDWQSKTNTERLIDYAEANPNYEGGLWFPQGPLFVRPEDHQGFGDLYVSRFEGGHYRLKLRIPKEAGIYPTA